MNTAAVSMHAGSGLQPNPAYSLGGAVLGTALVCAGLLWAFTHSQPLKVASGIVELHLATVPAMPLPHVVRTAPHGMPLPTRPTVIRPALPRPVLIPETRSLLAVPAPAPLDLSLPGSGVAPQAASPFVPQAFNPYSDLSKALAAPPPAPTMHNGDAYRSVYGSPVVNAGGRCLALQTLQAGPSPSAHTTVGFGVPCPGEYRPSMADELKAWAEKRARQLHLPPG